MRALTFIVASVATTAIAVSAQSTEPRRPIQHFVYYGLEHGRIEDPIFLSTRSIAGAQLKYTWRELERSEGGYDFQAIQEDLALLEMYGKQLFIQLQDVSFDENIVNVPDYLLQDRRFGGGVALKYEFVNDDETQPLVDGWVARRWDTAVRGRMDSLFQALAEEFDGRIAGINLAETSVGFGQSGKFFPEGFSYDSYYHGILDLMSAARRAFKQSDVIVYANFMPGEELPSDDHGYLRGLFEHADTIGVGVGGPDLLPMRWFQRQNSLRLIANRAANTVAGLAVQDGNLADRDPRTGRRMTIEELVFYAREELRLDYLFWGTEEPYWSEEVLPYLRLRVSQDP